MHYDSRHDSLRSITATRPLWFGWRAALALYVACLLPVGCDFASDDPPAQTTSRPHIPDLLNTDRGELIEESWETHLIGGAKVGHRHLRVYRLGEGDAALLRILATDDLEMRRFGERIRQKLTSASLETQDGQVLQLAYAVDDGRSTRQSDGWVSDGFLELDASDGAPPKRFVWSEQQRGIFAVMRSLQQQPLAPDESRRVEAFLPLLDRVVRFELKAMGPETVEIEGQQRELLRVEVSDELADGWQLPTVHWVDGEGTIIRSQEAFLNRETLQCTAEAAQRPNDLLRLDMGVDTGVAVSTPIENPHDTDYAVYRVRVEGLRTESVFPADPAQKLLPSDDGAAILTVRRITPDTPSALPIPPHQPTPDDTAPNALIQSDHPRVLAMSEAIAGSSADPWQTATTFEHYLYRTLGKVDFSQVFSAAGEVAERKRGDCSEHAVLLAALCRARGIPARVAVGLLYSPQDKSFLYHMWNEVWIKDRWVPLDATLGKGGVGSCHLKFRDSSLARQTPYGMVSPVINLIGRLQIEVISTE